jgi:hypothetical protein
MELSIGRIGFFYTTPRREITLKTLQILAEAL